MKQFIIHIQELLQYVRRQLILISSDFSNMSKYALLFFTKYASPLQDRSAQSAPLHFKIARHTVRFSTSSLFGTEYASLASRSLGTQYASPLHACLAQSTLLLLQDCLAQSTLLCFKLVWHKVCFSASSYFGIKYPSPLQARLAQSTLLCFKLFRH